MDSLTHIALGAVIGETYAGKSLGKKALLWGAIFQSIPDLDIIAAIFLEPTENLLAHRSITHSIIFAVAISLAGAAAMTQWNKKLVFNFSRWIVFISLEMFVHLLLDSFNNYGVGWFEPFNHSRISFNLISILDPGVSFWQAVALIALLWLPTRHQFRKIWARTAILITSLYLCSSAINKLCIHQTLENTIVNTKIEYKRYFTAPTLFNNLLWYCVVETKSGYYIGYRSVFDTTKQISLTYFPQRRDLIRGIENETDVRNLIRFSNGYFTIEKQPDALVFNDLRFGRIAGWTNQPTEFTFHYYLQRPDKNTLVVQRGRFAEFNLKTSASLLARIRGE